MEERKSFTFFRSYYDAMQNIDDSKVKADVFMAICAYALDGEVIPLQGIAAALFSLVKPNLDVSAKKAKAGSVGGLNRPSDCASKSEANRKQTRSKTEASCKQVASKIEASCKQTASEGEGDKGEGIYIPPTPLTGSTPRPKEQKVKFAEFVALYQKEFDALVAKHGKPTTNELIQILDNYKGSTGKKYQSDYRAILSWVEDKWRESQAKGRKGVVYASSNAPVDTSDMDRMLSSMSEADKAAAWKPGGGA